MAGTSHPIKYKLALNKVKFNSSGAGFTSVMTGVFIIPE
jgi:hypothetical protein